MNHLERNSRHNYRRSRAITAAILTWLLVPALGCTVEQPRTRCQTAPGAFSMKYTLVEGTGACAMLKGDIAGVHAYWRNDPSGPTVTRGPVAIKTDEVGLLLDKYGETADSKTISALGGFATDEPGADGFCEVEMTSPAKLKLAAVPPMPTGDAGAMTDPLPPVELTLEWSSVKFYVTAAQPGTMFSGRLKYAKTEGGQACTATFDVVGLWPHIGCEGSVTGADGKPTGSGKPDMDACEPCPDPAKMRISGSGISPGVDISCDAETLTCLPKSAPPSLRPAPLVCGS